MKIDPFMPDYYGDEWSLAAEAVAWLAGSPSREDILYYIGRLPEPVQVILLNYVTRRGAEARYTEKLEFFRGANAEWFVSSLDEADQLYYLAAFTQFSAGSVLREIKAKHPGGTTEANIPAGIANWAKDFMRRVDAVIDFAASIQYEAVLPYVSGMQASASSFSDLDAMRNELAGLIEAMEGRYRENRVETVVSEQDDERRFLSKLPFVAPAVAEGLISDGDTAAKSDLFMGLLRVMSLLGEFAQEAPAPVAIVKDRAEWALFEGFRLEAQIPFTAVLDSLHQVEFPRQYGHEVYLQYFKELITDENIEQGILSKLMSEQYAGLSDSLKPVYAMALYAFMRHTFVLSTACKPFTVDYLINAAKLAASEDEITGLISGMAGELERPLLQPFFEKVFHLLFSLTHSIPEPDL